MKVVYYGDPHIVLTSRVETSKTLPPCIGFHVQPDLFFLGSLSMFEPFSLDICFKHCSKYDSVNFAASR